MLSNDNFIGFKVSFNVGKFKVMAYMEKTITKFGKLIGI